MRKHLLKLSYLLILCISFLLTSHTTFAQSPQGIKYQAVVRDAGGIVIANTQVNLTIKILQGSTSGTAVCTELFTPTTNGFGLVNLELGSVSPVDFAAINWSAGPYFIEVSLNGNILGTSQLLSVPYAMYAKNAGTVNETDPVWIGDSSNYYTKLNLQTPYGAQLHFENITGFPNKIPKLLAPPVKGDMCAWDGTKWVNVVPGSEGEILVTDTTGMPVWLALGASAPTVGNPQVISNGNSFVILSIPVTNTGKTLATYLDWGLSASPLTNTVNGNPSTITTIGSGIYLDTIINLDYKNDVYTRSKIKYSTITGIKEVDGDIYIATLLQPTPNSVIIGKTSLTSQKIDCQLYNADDCKIFVEWKKSEDPSFANIMVASPSVVAKYVTGVVTASANITNLTGGIYEARFVMVTCLGDTIRGNSSTFEVLGGPIIDPVALFPLHTTAMSFQFHVKMSAGFHAFIDYKKTSNTNFTSIPLGSITTDNSTLLSTQIQKLNICPYNCQLRLMSPTGDTCLSDLITFQTIAPVINVYPRNTTSTSTNIFGTISYGQVSKIFIEYGLLNNPLTWIPLPPDSIIYSQSTTSINYILNNLAAGQGYRYRIKLITEANDTIYTAMSNFNTLSPTITTLPATNIKYTSVTLNGTINPQGGKVYDVRYEIAPSPSEFNGSWIIHYTLQDTLSGTNPINVPVDVYLGNDAVNWGTFYYRLKAKAPLENDGPVLSFVDIAPILTIQPATSVTEHSAVLNAVVCNNNSRYQNNILWEWWFDPSTEPSTKITGPILNANDNTYLNINTQIINLTAGKRVVYRLISINTNGDTTYSNTSTFVSSQNIVLTVSNPSNLKCNSVTLNGSINKQTVPSNLWFEIESNIYNVIQNPVQPSPVNFNVSATLTGLTPNSVYQYRMAGYNSSSDTVRSIYYSFQTPSMSLQDSLNKGIRPAVLIGMGANAYDFIGLNFPAEGGIIYYMNPNGSGSVFYNSTTLATANNPGACSGTNCGNTTQSGAINTGFMIASGCAISGTAAYVAHNLNYAGHTDWFLPSSTEVSYMHNAIQSQPALKAKYPNIDIFTSNVVESNYSEFWMYNLGLGLVYSYPYNLATVQINIIPCRSFPQ